MMPMSGRFQRYLRTLLWRTTFARNVFFDIGGENVVFGEDLEFVCLA